MIRQQMLCFVTPGAAAKTLAGLADANLQLPASMTRRLDRALQAAGCVHFATLALLPPRPPVSAPGGNNPSPSVMLELVVDEGITVEGAVHALLQDGFAVLWRIYQGAWSGPPDAGVEVRRRWLQAYLLDHASVADSGFVGARDRNVAQIVAEQRTLRAAREQLAGLGDNVGQEAEAKAQRLAQWVRDNGLSGTGDVARCSIWRPGALPAALRWTLVSIRLVLPALAVLGLLGLLGLSVAWLAPWLAQQLGSVDAPVFTVSDVAIPLMTLITVSLLLLVVMLILIIQTAQAIVAVAAVATVGLVAGVVAFIGLLATHEWAIFWCGVQLIAAGATALVALALGFAALLPLTLLPRAWRPPFFIAALALGTSLILALLTFVFSYVTQGQLSNLSCHTLRWQPGQSISWAERAGWVAATVVTMFAIALGMVKLWPVLQRWTVARFRALDLPREPLRHAAHQVHLSIDRCEARLIGRQSHMISLTEIRTPTRWMRWRLRVVLWLVSQLAQVVFTGGRLGEADGIKFGHWRVIDQGRRLLFCSNFDGAFGGYLDAFIAGASQGVNLIWGCTELKPRAAVDDRHPSVSRDWAFPPVRGLIFGGCKHEQAFKAYARASMVPHLYRFEAYNLSLADIERASRLRNALAVSPATIDTATADQILRAVES